MPWRSRERTRFVFGYDGDAEEAARFYAKTFPDSSVDAVHLAPGDYPSGKKGDVLTVEFTVMGIPCLGLNGGPTFKHNEAFSFQVATEDQAETDRYWNAIIGNGGQESACGWCKDKWGLSWQITPIALTRAITDPDPAAAKRAFDAMMDDDKDRHRCNRGGAPRLKQNPRETMMSLARRDFLGVAAAAALGPALAGGSRFRVGAPRSAGGTPAWPGYENAMVIDFLGSPGYFNYPENPPLNAAMIENARRSGITAMNVTVNGGDFESTMRRISPWLEYVSRYADTFRQVRTVDELLDAKKTRRVGIVLGFQDTTPYGQDITLLDLFHQVGVRVVQLTYNNRNLVGDGCLEPGNAGLSRFGRQVVERFNELGTIVDLSHCGKRTTAEGILASKAPVGITHTGCNAVARHPRSKDDEELKAMAERGGVVGIYMVGFLSPGRVSTGADLWRTSSTRSRCAARTMSASGATSRSRRSTARPSTGRSTASSSRSRIAAGIAAPGEDPEILFNVPELNTERRMERIADLLASRRHPDRVIEKVIGANWLRLCREVWR